MYTYILTCYHLHFENPQCCNCAQICFLKLISLLIFGLGLVFEIYLFKVKKFSFKVRTLKMLSRNFKTPKLFSRFFQNLRRSSAEPDVT